jgi:molecular chaperone GrpE (heat shock protein)
MALAFRLATPTVLALFGIGPDFENQRSGTTMKKKTMPVAGKSKAASKKTPAANVVRPSRPAPAQSVSGTGNETLAALREEIAGLRTAVEKSLSPVAAGSLDEVDALRRVLSYLFEAKIENILRDLVAVRQAAAALAGGQNMVADLDALLANLGAVRFEAERLEHVDPLIHAITREVQDGKLDDAVIVATTRPGFRTARGAVIAKALVTVNRRA